MTPELPSNIDDRVEQIIDWVRAHKYDIAKEEKVEITINMSGDKIKGKITTYPKWQ